jgi:hypothetical protein
LLEQRNRRPDDRWDDALVLAIAASTDSRHFSTRELFRHAAIDGALKRALDDACVENPRQCGKWLRRVEGRPIAGIANECVDLDHRDGIIWRARAVRV